MLMSPVLDRAESISTGVSALIVMVSNVSFTFPRLILYPGKEDVSCEGQGLLKLELPLNMTREGEGPAQVLQQGQLNAW
jgi:hypothetical protein